MITFINIYEFGIIEFLLPINVRLDNIPGILHICLIFLGGVGGCTFDLKIILGEFLISKVELGAQFQVQFGLLMMLPVFLAVLACVI